MNQPVLLVEDDQVLAETTRALLEWEGYRVRLASNGREALESIRGHRPCIVLLDLMMPIMSGWELLTELRRDPETGDLPVVVVSAVADRAPAGATAILHKPFEMEALLELIKQYCGC
jgi:CheY-like chemotaxis protein